MILSRIKMRATTTSATVILNSPLNHRFSVTYGLFFLLTTIIGNFSVSDADMVLSRHKDLQSTLTPPTSIKDIITERSHNLHNQDNSLSLTAVPFSRQNPVNVTVSVSDMIVMEPLSPLQNARLDHNDSASESHFNQGKRDFSKQKSIEKVSSSLPLVMQSIESGNEKVQLLPSAKRSLSPPLRSFHKRRKRNVSNTASFMGSSGKHKEFFDHPFSLWMNDSREMDRNWFLDQLLIRALANPEEWTVLRQSLDKVDEDIRALLAFEKEKSHAVLNHTVQKTLNDATTEKRFAFVYDQSGTTTGAKGQITSGNSSLHALPHTKPAGALHSSSRWKFTYHRVRDLNAAGKPTFRAIAAVVSREQTIASKLKNDTGKGVSESFSLVPEVPDRINMSRKASTTTDAGGYTSNNGSSSLKRLQDARKYHTILRSDNSESGYYSDDTGLGKRSNTTTAKPKILTILENKRIVSQGPMKHISQGIKWGVKVDDPLARKGSMLLSSSSEAGVQETEKELGIPASPQHQHQRYSDGTKQRENFELHRHHHGSKYNFKNNNIPCTKHNHHKFCNHRHRQNH